MYNVEKYEKNNKLQRRDVIDILNVYSNKIKWKNDHIKIIDVGCGDGSVTTQILKSYLPSNFIEIVGCDINKIMVDFANKHHRDETTHFFQLDIELDLPKELESQYDHVFSSYTLHWINNDKKTFQNIYSLLSKGGTCLLIFLGYIPIHEIYRVLSRTQKWSPYLKNVKKIMSLYHEAQKPEFDVAEIMRKVGFKDVDVTCQHRQYSFENIYKLQGLLEAILAFNIPKTMLQEYFEDFMKVVIENDSLGMTIDNSEEPQKVVMNYDLIIAYAIK